MPSNHSGDPDDNRRLLGLDLFIIHPALDPVEISRALGIEATHAHRAGDPRRNPSGKLLTGNYPDTRWRYATEQEVQGQWFASPLADFITRFASQRGYFRRIRESGGRAMVIVKFLDAEYFADEIPRDLLAQLLELDLDLGIEAYGVPQLMTTVSAL